MEVASSELISVEPEESFQALPAAPPTAAGPYREIIRAAAEKHGVDETLIARLIAAESNFNPKAVSRKQALGLMQLLPKTAARYSVVDVFDPAQNIEGGTHYLKDCSRNTAGICRWPWPPTMPGPTRWSDTAGSRPSRRHRAT